MTTVAGNGTEGFAGDGGQATDANFFFPGPVVLDATGNIFICDANNHRVRRVDATTNMISTFAGNGMLDESGFSGAFAGDGGPATDASFNRPSDIALDAAGNLYIMDRENNRLRKVDATTGNVSTIAGSGESAYSGDGGPATAAALASPFGVHVNGAGQIFIVDTQNQRVRMIDSDGNINSVAGSGSGGFEAAGFDGESNTSALSAQLNFPIDVGTDGSGNLYIIDSANHRVRKVSSGDGTTSGGGDSGGGDTTGGDTGSTTVLPTGTRGPIALDLDTTTGDQMLLQTAENPKAGDNIVVDIIVTEGATGQGGFQAKLTFDPAQLEFSSVDAKDVFAGGVAINTPGTGSIDINFALLGAAASKDAGSMAHATFKVLDGFTGETNVTLASGQLASGALEIGPGGSFVVIGGVVSSIPTDPVERADFSGDGEIGFTDFLSFAGAFGKKTGDTGYDERIDLNGDGEVGFTDFLTFASLFGQKVGG